MPIIFGQAANNVAEIVTALKQYREAVRGRYRATYRHDPRSADGPYTRPVLERPPVLQEEPDGRIYPWEQLFVAAAACSGSDYPALATYWGLPLESIELSVEGVFDPRGQFAGLGSLLAPDDARHCFVSLHLKATLVSTAPRADLERLHRRVMSHNMVLGALRAIPLSDELLIRLPAEARAH